MWNLISSRIQSRWLPEGYILDSGAPCTFRRTDVARDELFIIVGWTLTDLCNDVLKKVLNHTRNIQGKDIERLPYPDWVTETEKREAVTAIKSLIKMALSGISFTHKNDEVRNLNKWGLYT